MYTYTILEVFYYILSTVLNSNCTVFMVFCHENKVSAQILLYPSWPISTEQNSYLRKGSLRSCGYIKTLYEFVKESSFAAVAICLSVFKYRLPLMLLEKQSKFPWYNMKWRGKRDTRTTRNIPRCITFSPLHFMLFRGKSISFGTV